MSVDYETGMVTLGAMEPVPEGAGSYYVFGFGNPVSWWWEPIVVSAMLASKEQRRKLGEPALHQGHVSDEEVGRRHDGHDEAITA